MDEDPVDDRAVGRRRAIRLSGGMGAGAVLGAVGLLRGTPAAAAPVTFNTIVPYRSLDSRTIFDARLAPGFEIDWDLWTDQLGTSRIPSNAAAVTYNLTVTQTDGGPGFLAMYPAGAAYPGVSSGNWTSADATVANGGTVALSASNESGPGSVTLLCDGRGGTDYIVDVTGYYI